jgi:hypothetical protein
MYHGWGRRGMHRGFWWENQKKRDQEDRHRSEDSKKSEANHKKLGRIREK